RICGRRGELSPLCNYLRFGFDASSEEESMVMKCPAFEELIDYLDGRLEGRRAEVVGAHLATACESCAGDRQWYERVRAVAGADSSFDPPAWVVKRAIKTFTERPVQPKAKRFGR